MMVFPDVQKKAQAELDHVVGPDRLPNIDDYPNLPYIRCCIKETLRWMPTVVMGVPHAVTKEDTYNGWRIPKGATIINNVWYVPNQSNHNMQKYKIDTISGEFTWIPNDHPSHANSIQTDSKETTRHSTIPQMANH